MLIVRRRKHITPCMIRVCFLAFLWISAMLAGILVCSVDSRIHSLMLVAPGCSLSIVGVLVITILPLAISIAGLAANKFAILYIIYIIKAFTSGYLLFAILRVYGSAGWLMHLLLLFSDNMTNFLILWITFRHIKGKSNTFLFDALICTTISIAIGITDYLFVAPFLCAIAG